jgi:polar amino acid transport system substrate-binding protein
MRISKLFLLGAALGWSTFSCADNFRFVTEEFFPFSYSVADPATGISRPGGPLVEIAELICERIQYNCSFEIHPWRRSLALAEQGAVDGIFTVIKSPEREQMFHITQMLVRSEYVLFSHLKTAFQYQEPEDLAGRTIGVYGPSGTSYVLSRVLEKAPGARMYMVTDNLQLLRMLNSERFGTDGLALINEDVAQNLIATHGLSIREAGHFKPISYGIGFSRKAVSEARFKVFQDALRHAVEDGSVREILYSYGLTAID